MAGLEGTDLKFEAVSILLLLLPGFLTAGLVRTFHIRPHRSDFDKVTDALLYSFVVYVIFSVCGGDLPVNFRDDPKAGPQFHLLQLNSLALIELAAIAIVLALAIGLMTTTDFPMGVLRSLRITQRTSRTSVWNEVFHDPVEYVQVELADGRQVLGWLKYYSDTPEEAALFLEDAVWVGENQSVVDIPGSGILLTKESGIHAVMLLAAERPPQILTVPR